MKQMAARADGFQPCDVDASTVAPIPRWERNLVVAAVSVHLADVGLDVAVALMFLSCHQWGFFFGTTGIMIWAWLVSSLYTSFGGGGSGASADFDGGGRKNRIPQFFLSFAQVQIFVEAYRCLLHTGDSDYLHTLRLMEAVLEAAPNALLQLCALVLWASDEDGMAPPGAALLLRLSVLASFASVGLGLAMWEQKVQFRASAIYVSSVAVMRAFEIASRGFTLALFAGLAQPQGLWWVLLADYGAILALVARHRSVQLTYGLFVALPLVLVSLEPLVWRREDHAVPKDYYYLVRIIEFGAMWIVILHQQDEVDSRPSWLFCEILGLLSTLGLYVFLPFVWRAARHHELSRDVTDWGEDGAKDRLQGDGPSDSEADSSGSEGERQHINAGEREASGACGDDELPPE